MEICGHTDSKGSHQYNIDLSYRRANSVVEYAVSKGIPQKRFSIMAYGKTKPIAENKTEKGRAINRRVEFRSFEFSESVK